MKITKEARMHLETAELLIRGIQQSIKINDSEPGTPPPGAFHGIHQAPLYSGSAEAIAA